MSSLVKNILIFTAGAIGGAVGAYLYTKNKYENIINDEIDEAVEKEVASMKKIYDKRLELAHKANEREGEDANPNMENPEDKKKTPVKQESKEDKIVSMNKRKYNKIVTNYNKFSTPDDIEDDRSVVEDADYIKGEQATLQANSGKHDYPYVIDIRSFSEEMDHFDKVTIYYYEEDDTLADADESVMTDIDGTVGEALFYFEDDVDTVYVRNERLSIDYEIILLRKSYAETVVGYTTNSKNVGSRRYYPDEE